MIYEIEPKDWKELLDHADRFPGFAFRGQARYDWELATTLERLGKVPKGFIDFNLSNREFVILDYFKRYGHNLIDKPPSLDEKIEWLAILQHHGGPTRFLDFTTSMFIGIFFACESSISDSALWLINTHKLFDRQSEPLTGNMTTIHQKNIVLKYAENYIGVDSSGSGLYPIEPKRFNERMLIQKSLFIMPKNINETFMYNMKHEYNWSDITFKQTSLSEFRKIAYLEFPDVAKIKIKSEWLGKLLHLLDDMNVNTNTLFPGLDGFARSLRIHLRQNLENPPDYNAPISDSI